MYLQVEELHSFVVLADTNCTSAEHRKGFSFLNLLSANRFEGWKRKLEALYSTEPAGK
jgi:hypothetical protein